MCKQNSWSEQYNFRCAIAARFGRVFDLPLVRRARDVLLDVVRDDADVLDVGAGDRRMREMFAEKRSGVRYRSLDIDPRGGHDYHALDAVDRAFDCVFALEVAEHLSFEELPQWLAQLAKFLKPGGHLVLSTPNTYYPPAYLRDVSHRTPLCYDELGGLLESIGLEVTRIARIYNHPPHQVILRRYVFGWLFRLIGIDFARQIIVVARKPAQDERE